ncbi:MAG: diguanylate cyclase [Candidatus Dormibacteraeota bacterium]|nr:diguanylate cyclase [Candidatus Dormibacteraeota bacterium]
MGSVEWAAPCNAVADVTPSFKGGAALEPLLHLVDRVPVAYVLHRRPSEQHGWIPPLAMLCELGNLTAPAPLFMHVRSAGMTRLAAALGIAGASAARIVLLCRPNAPATSAASRALDALRGAGCQVCVELSPSPHRCYEDLIRLHPEYVFLHTDSIRNLDVDLVASAQLSALVTLATRLDIRVVAREVPNEKDATLLTQHGIQLGSGSWLLPTLAMDPRGALPNDCLVTPAWFQRHPARVLDEASRPASETRLMAMHGNGPGATDADGFAASLAQLARSLQAEHDAARVLEIVATAIPQIVPSSSLAIFEADWQHDALVPRVLVGDDVSSMRDTPLAMSQGITGWAFRRGRPYKCDSTAAHPAAGTVPGTEADQGDESMLVVPLVAADRSIGVLDLWRRGLHSFTDADLERASLLAHLAAAAWHSALLYAELEERSRTDPLTGLHNARWWHEMAGHEEARIRRSGVDTGVLLLDLDHFKAINDSGGHSLGDSALRTVAEALRSTVRLGDEVVRYGGEEFLILLHQSGLHGAVTAAEAIRTAIEALPPVGSGLRVTASIGVASFPGRWPTIDHAVRAADQAMYEAKAAGRNRVATASSASAPAAHLLAAELSH